MLPSWTASAVAKAKLTMLLATSLAAGGVGGAVVLSHVAPTTQMASQAAGSTDPESAQASQDPESSDAQDPESTDAQDPETSDAQDPETGDAQDPETGDAQDPETGDSGGSGAPGCPAGVKNHGDYVSSV